MGVGFTHVARGVDSKSLPQSMQRCDAKRVMASVRVGKIAVWNAAVGCNPGDMVSKEVPLCEVARWQLPLGGFHRPPLVVETIVVFEARSEVQQVSDGVFFDFG